MTARDALLAVAERLDEPGEITGLPADRGDDLVTFAAAAGFTAEVLYNPTGTPESNVA